MKKNIRLLPLVLLLALLCACTQESTPSKAASPSVSPVDESVSPETSPDALAGTPVSPANVDNSARCRVFRTFLSDNYKAISDAYSGGISGIGFLDLDCDGGIEMVIFDSGASAALGAEFFDIDADGAVECVSANLEAVGRDFGGKYFSDVTVNANRFDDFRLMKDKSSGEEFFVVESGNGALDFKYTEQIRFRRGADDVLTLESLYYDYQETDDDGNILGETWRVGGKSATQSEYEAAKKTFEKSVDDQNYTAAGVFVWDSGANYEKGAAGLQQMAEKAFSLWQANARTGAN